MKTFEYLNEHTGEQLWDELRKDVNDIISLYNDTLDEILILANEVDQEIAELQQRDAYSSYKVLNDIRKELSKLNRFVER